MAPQIVKLNIGGVFYDTSLQTLLVEGSYFAGLLSGNWEDEKDESGRIFIDRDGKAFKHILDFMRNGSRMVAPEILSMKERVRREADYYILPELAEMLKPEEVDKVKLDVGGIHYTTSVETLKKKPLASLASLVSMLDVDGGNYFDTMLSGDLNRKKDENGCIFIDRDGKAFEYVLHFLRNGIKMVFPGSSEMKERICREADFYRLPALRELFSTNANLFDLHICYNHKSYVNRHLYYDISLSMACMKSYPGCWFDKTFSSEDIDLPTAMSAKQYKLFIPKYFLDRQENYVASALVAQYVGGTSTSDQIKIGNVDADFGEEIMKAVAFFDLPRAVGNEIIAHYNSMMKNQ